MPDREKPAGAYNAFDEEEIVIKDN
jgi:hypothetical protein